MTARINSEVPAARYNGCGRELRHNEWPRELIALKELVAFHTGPTWSLGVMVSGGFEGAVSFVEEREREWGYEPLCARAYGDDLKRAPWTDGAIEAEVLLDEVFSGVGSERDLKFVGLPFVACRERDLEAPLGCGDRLALEEDVSLFCESAGSVSDRCEGAQVGVDAVNVGGDAQHQTLREGVDDGSEEHAESA